VFVHRRDIPSCRNLNARAEPNKVFHIRKIHYSRNKSHLTYIGVGSVLYTALIFVHVYSAWIRVIKL